MSDVGEGTLQLLVRLDDFADKIVKATPRKYVELVNACQAAKEAAAHATAEIKASPLKEEWADLFGLPVGGVAEAVASALEATSKVLVTAFGVGVTKICVLALDSFRLFLKLGFFSSIENETEVASRVGKLFEEVVFAIASITLYQDANLSVHVLMALLTAILMFYPMREKLLLQVLTCTFGTATYAKKDAIKQCAKHVTHLTILLFVNEMEVHAAEESYRPTVDVKFQKYLRQHQTRLLELRADLSRDNQVVITETMEHANQAIPQHIAGMHASTGGSSSAAGGGILDRDEHCVCLLIRGLSGIAMRSSDSEEQAAYVSAEKLGALELLEATLRAMDCTMDCGHRVIENVKEDLCKAILNSSLGTLNSEHEGYAFVCLVFVHLVKRFRRSLKTEIGVCYPLILLRLLEGSKADINVVSAKHKCIVSLKAISRILNDPQTCVDIFVNFDCDVHQPNLFERTANGLDRMSKQLSGASDQVNGSGKSSNVTVDEQTLEFDHTDSDLASTSSIRRQALDCLLCTAKSLAEWTSLPPMGEAKDEDETEESSTFVLMRSDSNAVVSEGDSERGKVSRASSIDAVEHQRAYKIALAEALDIFNKKPNKGVEYMVGGGWIERSPKAVCQFLTTPGLSKTMIGEYLGDPNKFNLSVLHEYGQSHDFTGMKFDMAIRQYLADFRLPGEAQKIDRVMEKFAGRYVENNPDVFRGPDTAYVLAYSIIMLNTDAHNQMVKNKMSLEDFIKNNKGIDLDGADLPRELLEDIYSSIVNNEIKMKAGESEGAEQVVPKKGMEYILSALNPNYRRRQFEQAQTVAMEKACEALQNSSESEFQVAESMEHARPMMEVAWPAMLGAFSVPMDESDDPHIIAMCLQGFRHAIHTAAALALDKERTMFVSSLAKFTVLQTTAEMKPKNVEAIKMLIDVALNDGNCLQDSWSHILRCISRIEHLQLIQSGLTTDALLLGGDAENGDNAVNSSTSRPRSVVLHSLDGPQVNSINIKEAGAKEAIGWVLENTDRTQMGLVFERSKTLSGSAIVDFVEQLCEVSLQELANPVAPRIFSLQKIVEVADHNLGRIRLVWSKIWVILSKYFIRVCCHPNQKVSMYGVDSLRQLIRKFMGKDENTSRDLQKDFLQPFDVVFRNTKSAEIRELIIVCVSQIALERVSSLRAGWSSIFGIFSAAAKDTQKKIVNVAFTTIERIVREHFDEINEARAFTVCVKCLLAYTSQELDIDVSLNSIAFLSFCALQLGEGKVRRAESQDADLEKIVEEGADKDQQIQMNEEKLFWFPLLDGMSKLIWDPRLEIRSASVEVLFDLLNCHGPSFTEDFWHTVFKDIVFDMFKGVDTSKEGMPGNCSVVCIVFAAHVLIRVACMSGRGHGVACHYVCSVYAPHGRLIPVSWHCFSLPIML
eukprot:scaffold137_cov398-Prasinococcus_capsulatus_cf.AAC.14